MAIQRRVGVFVDTSVEVFPVGKTVTAVYTGTFRTYLDGPYTYESIEVGASAAITGTDLIFDVLKNGTSIWVSQNFDRPTIAVGTQRAVTFNPPNTSLFSAGDYLTFNIPQIGSNTSVDIQAILRLRRTG